MSTSAEAATAPRSQRRLPDFFIVGHHKSGTTALYEMLRRHPQIFMPDLKEPRWFDSDLHGATSAGSKLRTFEEYLALFEPAGADQIVGEASPSYLRSHTAARAIAEVAPGARCIAIFREPASFVRSMHLQLVQEHVESEKDLRRAVAGEEVVREGQRRLRYSDHVRYAEQLARYHSVFPREQVLALIYDDFRRENEDTVRAVLRFLGVDDTAPVEVMDANPTVVVRSLRADRIVRGLYGGRSPAGRAARKLVRTLTPARVRSGALSAVRRRALYGRPTPPDEELMGELRSRYAPEVRALGEYLDRDLLALWGYDDVR
jgi:hypothetical protein